MERGGLGARQPDVGAGGFSRLFCSYTANRNSTRWRSEANGWRAIAAIYGPVQGGVGFDQLGGHRQRIVQVRQRRFGVLGAHCQALWRPPLRRPLVASSLGASGQGKLL